MKAEIKGMTRSWNNSEELINKFRQRNRNRLPIQNLILHTMSNYLLLPSLDMVAIAQLVRASDCGSEGRGFEPHWLPIKDSEFSGSFIFHLFEYEVTAINVQCSTINAQFAISEEFPYC
jgi:hypothetical protein